jgi:UDP-glucose 4-epimerase
MNRDIQYTKALVTGGAGFIGSHIVRRLIESGIRTVVLDDLSIGKREHVTEGAELIIGSVCDSNAVQRALSEVDVVLHLAARVSIRDSFRGFVQDVDTNVMGTVNLLRCMEGSRVKKLIFASSMATYGNAKCLPISEEHPLDPTSPYGISKLASEKYVLRFSQYLGVESVILRYFNTYGPGQTFTPYVGVITIFIQKLLRGENLPIFGDGRQMRDFVSVDDVAEATVLALKYGGNARIFNVGTGIGTPINSLAGMLKRAMGASNQIEYLPSQLGETADSIADIALARDTLGFMPRWSIEEKLPEIIEWNTRIATKK